MQAEQPVSHHLLFLPQDAFLLLGHAQVTLHRELCQGNRPHANAAMDPFPSPSPCLACTCNEVNKGAHAGRSPAVVSLLPPHPYSKYRETAKLCCGRTEALKLFECCLQGGRQNNITMDWAAQMQPGACIRAVRAHCQRAEGHASCVC